jgi:DNA replication protein DnaC
MKLSIIGSGYISLGSDAVFDRLLHHAARLELGGEPLRKRHGGAEPEAAA